MSAVVASMAVTHTLLAWTHPEVGNVHVTTDGTQTLKMPVYRRAKTWTNAWMSQIPARCNRYVLTLQDHTIATACLVGETEALMPVSISTNAPRGPTAARQTHSVWIRKDPTNVTATVASDRQWPPQCAMILMNVQQEATRALPTATPTASTLLVHTLVVATAATTCLATNANVSNHYFYLMV